ncbi:MAG: hypothetical protein BVN34_09105 [Proteobacteria bacterium ST_bin12]|nr:MAG: hypothetical protein BVN34_09105 [Proteobacteria bacterium ST_bin12]
MSIMSAHELDDSDILYKQFAILANSYVDKLPEPNKLHIAQIPLENLYRLFEMYRYDAFADDNHSGVLDLDNVNHMTAEDYPWHTDIKKALTSAFNHTFGRDNNDAIDEIEDVLKQISLNNPVMDNKKDNAKKFFNHFIHELVI